MVVNDDEPAGDVFKRIVDEGSLPIVLAISRPHVPHGFVFMTIITLNDSDDATPDRDGVLANGVASIGMLYDSLISESTPHAVLTLPHDWEPTRISVGFASKH